MKKINILIVEDHALTLFALKTSLSSCDFVEDIFEADNALLCYDILRENKIRKGYEGTLFMDEDAYDNVRVEYLAKLLMIFSRNNNWHLIY